MADIKVIDNFLTDTEHAAIENLFKSPDFAWFYNDSVTFTEAKNNFYFTHLFYKDAQPRSHFYEALRPIINKLDVKAFLRIKGSLYPNIGYQIKNEWHADYSFPHKGALYYVNTNNGYTEMEDGTTIECKANRVLLFDPTVKHRSVQCSDQKCRFTINFNYF